MTDPMRPHQAERADLLIIAGNLDVDELSDHAQAMLRWIAGWGPDTVAGICELFLAAHTAGTLAKLALADATNDYPEGRYVRIDDLNAAVALPADAIGVAWGQADECARHVAERIARGELRDNVLDGEHKVLLILEGDDLDCPECRG